MKRKYFKDGNPEFYNFFTDLELKQFTPKEKAMWTPYSEAELAPIPEEVIQFNEAQEEVKPCCKDEGKCEALEAQVAELKAEIEKSKKTVDLEIKVEPVEVEIEVKPKEKKVVIPEITEEDRKVILIEECRSRGLKVTRNMKLETLEKKLADADN